MILLALFSSWGSAKTLPIANKKFKFEIVGGVPTDWTSHFWVESAESDDDLYVFYSGDLYDAAGKAKVYKIDLRVTGKKNFVVSEFAGESITPPRSPVKLSDARAGNPTLAVSAETSPSVNFTITDQAEGPDSTIVHFIPIQLMDLRGTGETDDIPISFRSGNNDNSEKNIAWIEAITSTSNIIPHMPQLRIFTLGAPADFKIRWRMENRYPRRDDRDNLDFPANDVITDRVIPAVSAWNIYEEYSNPSRYFGGNCTIYMKLLDNKENPLSPEIKLRFRIRGRNPSDVNCKEHILDNDGKVWYAWAVAKHESKDSNGFYNQFATGLANGGAGAHGAKGEPFYSPVEGDGWGLFQRDSSSGYPVTTEETWNWDGNMRGFLNDEYPEHLKYSNTYVDSVKDENSETFEKPEFTIKEVEISGRDVLALTRYNGAQGRSKERLLHFDGSKSAGQRWSHDLPNAPNKNQSYAAEIMDQYNEN